MKRILTASLLALTGAGVCALVPTTAHAQSGQISLNLTGSNDEENSLIALGLGLYALAQSHNNDANVRQRGNNNLAGMLQNGFCNFGIIEQEGNNHSGSIAQNGNCNSYGLFQFGEGATSHVNQNGHGNAGVTFAFGF